MERLGEPPSAKRAREVVDEFRSGHKQRIEAILDRAVGDRHGEMCFASPGFPAKNQASAFCDEIGRRGRAQELQADRTLVCEVEIVNRLQKWKARARTMRAIRVC